MKEPALRPLVCTETVKVVSAARFSPGFGEVMIEVTMFDVEGIFPITDGKWCQIS